MVLQLHCCLDKLSCNNLLLTVSIPLVNITEYNNAMAAEFMLLKSEKTGDYFILMIMKKKSFRIQHFIYSNNKCIYRLPEIKVYIL